MEAGIIAPSGEQIEVTAGDQRAVVVEIGGGLRSYSAGDRDLVDGYGSNEMSSSGRGQVLIPWPNRLQDGNYDLDGRRHQLPLNEPGRRNAIHRLVSRIAWTVSAREPHRAAPCRPSERGGLPCSAADAVGSVMALAAANAFAIARQGVALRGCHPVNNSSRSMA
jgi:galactose mutarotase-like enzyme